MNFEKWELFSGSPGIYWSLIACHLRVACPAPAEMRNTERNTKRNEEPNTEQK